MPGEVRRDLERSQSALTGVVWPAVAHFCGGGELVSVEGSPIATHLALDMLAGIDGYQRHTDRGLRGVASRVQPIWRWVRPWDTFTIRLSRISGAETEYVKRLFAIENPCGGWMYAHLTIQAYVCRETGALLSAAVVRTKDLFLHAKECREAHGWNGKSAGACYTNSTNNARFVVVPWEHLQASGVAVKMVRADVEELDETGT